MKNLTFALVLVFWWLASTFAFAQVTLRNMLPPPPNATYGEIIVVLNNAGEIDGGSLRLTATNAVTGRLNRNVSLVYDYFSYVTTLNGTFRLSNSTIDTKVEMRLGDAFSRGHFTGSNGNRINWTATSSIPLGGDRMTTAYSFTSANSQPIGPLVFHQYLDEDVQGSGNDIILDAGLASSGNLSLFTVDNDSLIGISHGGVQLAQQGLQNASFLGWTANTFPFLRGEIGSSGIDFTTNGVFSTVNYSPTGTVDIANLPPFDHPMVGPAYGFGDADPSSSLAWSVDPTASTAGFSTFVGGLAGADDTLPDLGIFKDVSPTHVAGNEPVTYTLTVSNAGAAATGIEVTDDFPFEYFATVTSTDTNVVIDPFSGFFGFGTSAITWNIPVLGPGESTSTVFTAFTESPLNLANLLPQGTNLIVNVAEVTDDQTSGPDANILNNTNAAVLAIDVQCRPVIVGCPPDQDFGCNPDFNTTPLPTLAELQAGIAVFGQEPLIFLGVDDTGTCARSLTYTWAAFNSCGITTCQTELTWHEIAGPPSLANPLPDPYQDATYGCGANPPPPDAADFATNALLGFCLPPASAIATQQTFVVGSTTNVQHIFDVTDGCGQRIVYTQTLTIISSAQPDVQIVSCPSNSHLGCNPTTRPTATDLASQIVVQNGGVQLLAAITNLNGCSTWVDYFFEATNTCSSTQCSVRVEYIEDTDPPLAAASGVFADRVLDCGEPVPAVDTGGFSSNAVVDVCDVMVTSKVQAELPGPIYQPVHHIYTAVDACSNTLVYTQTFMRTLSTIPPTLLCPEDLDLGCKPTTLPDEAELQAMLDVSNGVLVTLSNTVSGTPCAREAVWVFRATNGCGFADCAMTVRWADPTGIQLVSPLPAGVEDQDLNCGALAPSPNPTLFLTALEGTCGEVDVNVTVNTSASRVQHVYTAADACGQEVTHMQTFTKVEDLAAPVFENLPTSLTLFGDVETCRVSLPYLAVRGVDACDGETVVSQSPSPGTLVSGPGSVQVTFTTVDSKGNSAQTSQPIPITCGSAAPGSLSGVKFEDTDANGIQDSKLVTQQFDPVLVVLLDVSGSTSQRLTGSPVGDLNLDGLAGTTLDAEISALVDLNADLQVRFPAADVVLIPFDSIAGNVPFGAGNATAPGAALDAALRQVTAQGGTDYAAAFSEALATVDALAAPIAATTVLLVTDGQSDQPFAAELAQLRQRVTSIQAFGIGPQVNLSTLQSIDPAAVSSANAAELSAALRTATISDQGLVNIGEGGMPGITIYLDTNNNSRLDVGEPSDVTAADGSWRVDGLAPGSYRIREVIPSGMIQTFPVGGSHVVTLNGGQHLTGLDFGNTVDDPGGPGPVSGKIQGLVWNDGSNDGNPNNESLGLAALANIGVLLETVNGVQLDSTATGNDGRFCFDNLPAGSYVVKLDDATVPLFFPNRSTASEVTVALSDAALDDILFGLVAEETAVGLEQIGVVDGALSWTTGWEKDSLGFYAEHSVDGANWTRVNQALILSAGASTYELAIATPGFYRLLEVDNALFISELQTIGYAPPAGEPTQTVAANAGEASFTTDPDHRTWLVHGLPAGHTVLDVTDPGKAVRLHGATLSNGGAAYFSWPSGRAILAR